MKLLKKIPFFLFLLVVFFCLHGSVENYGYLHPYEVLTTGAVILIWVTLFFSLIFFGVKNYVLASLITFFISLWYLFFGVFHDWVKSYLILSFISSYSILIPLLVIITILLFIFLKRNKNLHSKLFFYLNILLIIYCVIDGGLLLNKKFTPQKEIVSTVNFDTTKVTAKPNVYYLLFDEYPGYKSLKDSFAFANDSLYNYLSKKQFNILPTYANYDFTLFSMSSILNMNYVDPGYNPKKVCQRDLQIRTNEVKNGAVFNIFKQMGYSLCNYSLFDVGETYAISNQSAFLPVHSLLLTDKILHNRIIRTSGWLFKTGKLAMPYWKKKYLYQHDTYNMDVEKMLANSAGQKSAGPKFCYAHFILPHWPFYRDSSGAYNSDEILEKSSLLADKKLFLSYVKYTNTVMEYLIDSITGKDSAAIVIVMSDHGFRSYKNTVPLEPFNFNNICAVRFPGKYLPVYKEAWSNVNFFRYLFNTAYGQHIGYLKDSSIILKYE